MEWILILYNIRTQKGKIKKLSFSVLMHFLYTGLLWEMTSHKWEMSSGLHFKQAESGCHCMWLLSCK